MGLEHLDTVMSFALIMLLLSLQITILVQMVVALLGLRGWNLSWSLTQVLRQFDPELKLQAHATKLAREVLKHPALTHIWSLFGRRKATAIRPQELLRVLDDLAHNPSSKLDKAVKKALAAALKKTVVGETPERGEMADRLVAELTNLLPGYKQAVQAGVDRALQQKKQIEVELKTWFDTVMDRSTERFTLYTRWITGGIAFALAFTLHIDSIQIFKQLSTSGEVRTRLVQQVDSTLEQAGSLLTATREPKPLAAEAIRAMSADLTDPRDRSRIATVPEILATRRAGEEWLSKQFSGPQLSKAMQAYQKRYEEATVSRVKELGASLDEVKDSLDETHLHIIPHPIPYWNTYLHGLHFLGVTVTGIFLSLGAPFWYNALRQLANLRPILAGKVAPKTPEEQKESPKS